MSNSDSIRFAGDISIELVSIVTSKGLTQNITNQVMAIEIYEDLFSPFITGVINVKEMYDFINLFPFIGEEYLTLNVYTPTIQKENRINQQFYIYKVSNREIVGHKSTMYQIHFISKEALVDVNKRISKSYSGNISDIALDICTHKADGLESDKPLNIEKTANKTKFVSNFWSPVKCLNYSAGTATNPEGSSNYLFFESRKGLNFVSLDSLYNQTATQEFVYNNFSRDVLKDGRSLINLNEDYKQIFEISVPTVFDYFERIRSGMFASKMISHDMTTKKYVAKNFEMLSDFTNNLHLNPYPAASQNNIKTQAALTINYQKQYNLFNGYGDVTNASTLQKRLSQLQQAEATKLEIMVAGRTDYTVGMKVQLNLNKIQPLSKSDLPEETRDNIFSGNYLISAVSHYINRDRHECTMEVIKDSFVIDLNENTK